MCKSSIHDFLQRLPKCEHHMHLEGALSPHVLFQLAEKNQIKLPQDDDAFQSPEALLKRYQKSAFRANQSQLDTNEFYIC